MRRFGAIGAAFALAVSVMVVNPSRATANIASGWELNATTGHWYALVDGMGWLDAEAYAVRHDGHLVTVNDQAEQDWLSATFADPNLGIGFTDTATEGNWVWLSGETPGFEFWADGEPNDYVGPENDYQGEDFAVLNWELDGRWNDLWYVSRWLIEVPAPFAANDDLLDMTWISENWFAESPAMNIASLEAGEDVACDPSGIEASVWYAFWNPALGGLRVQIDGDQDAVAAAVYGPFESPPASVDEIADMVPMCVYGVGQEAALNEGIERGFWLVQLVSVAEPATPPSIQIERGWAYYWVPEGSISTQSAVVDRSGTITFTGTAECRFMWWSPDGGGAYPQAQWNDTGDGYGYFSYELQGFADQALGRKTLLQGGGGGFIDCTNVDENGYGTWHLWSRAWNGKFGPNATSFGFDIGGNTCDEQDCWFYGFASYGNYLKVSKAR